VCVGREAHLHERTLGQGGVLVQRGPPLLLHLCVGWVPA
jgi:hypothetical protein